MCKKLIRENKVGKIIKYFINMEKKEKILRENKVRDGNCKFCQKSCLGGTTKK